MITHPSAGNPGKQTEIFKGPSKCWPKKRSNVKSKPAIVLDESPQAKAMVARVAERNEELVCKRCGPVDQVDLRVRVFGGGRHLEARCEQGHHIRFCSPRTIQEKATIAITYLREHWDELYPAHRLLVEQVEADPQPEKVQELWRVYHATKTALEKAASAAKAKLAAVCEDRAREAEGSKHGGKRIDPKVYGSDTLSCWDYGKGEVRVQSRCPKVTELLRKSYGSLNRVGINLSGPYLQIFQLERSLKSVRRVVDRLNGDEPQEASEAQT